MPNRDGLGPSNFNPYYGGGYRSYGRGNTFGLAVIIGAAIGYGYHIYMNNHRPKAGGRNLDEGFSLEQEKSILEERLDRIKELMGQ